MKFKNSYYLIISIVLYIIAFVCFYAKIKLLAALSLFAGTISFINYYNGRPQK